MGVELLLSREPGSVQILVKVTAQPDLNSSCTEQGA